MITFGQPPEITLGPNRDTVIAAESSIVRVVSTVTFSYADTPVPEPAIWAMMIASIGLVGAAARRKRAVTALVSA